MVTTILPDFPVNTTILPVTAPEVTASITSMAQDICLFSKGNPGTANRLLQELKVRIAYNLAVDQGNPQAASNFLALEGLLGEES